ncbi:DUF7688 family protein [Phocaeicola sp.]|uniref:DUF7688 family protein n=1 Tax=Phocaeicola sp. TaxID=2773926 RepID=UPI003AB45E4A
MQYKTECAKEQLQELSNDISIPMIFKNLCGKNFSGNDYQNYLRTVCQDIGVTTGAIEYYADNVLIEKATIPVF